MWTPNLEQTFTITKSYHFYAAHRNPEGGIKCGRIHGHTYEVTVDVTFPRQKGSSVSMLFQDIDNIIEPIIKEHDHVFLLWDKDPLVPFLESAGEPFLTLPFVTSAENLAEHLLHKIRSQNLNVTKLTLQETKSSSVTIS